MSEIVKVEINIIDGDWQWMGKLSEENLSILCAIADVLNDFNPKEDEVTERDGLMNI